MRISWPCARWWTTSNRHTVESMGRWWTSCPQLALDFPLNQSPVAAWAASAFMNTSRCAAGQRTSHALLKGAHLFKKLLFPTQCQGYALQEFARDCMHLFLYVKTFIPPAFSQLKRPAFSQKHLQWGSGHFQACGVLCWCLVMMRPACGSRSLPFHIAQRKPIPIAYSLSPSTSLPGFSYSRYDQGFVRLWNFARSNSLNQPAGSPPKIAIW